MKTITLELAHMVGLRFNGEIIADDTVPEGQARLDDPHFLYLHPRDHEKVAMALRNIVHGFKQ
jgi:hypothetical protein